MRNPILCQPLADPPRHRAHFRSVVVGSHFSLRAVSQRLGKLTDRTITNPPRRRALIRQDTARRPVAGLSVRHHVLAHQCDTAPNALNLRQFGAETHGAFSQEIPDV